MAPDMFPDGFEWASGHRSLGVLNSRPRLLLDLSIMVLEGSNPSWHTLVAYPSLSATGPDSSSMRLLLIEDDTMLGKALVRGFKRIGMAVDWVRNGPDGYEALKRAEHSVALLDIGLPEMSGLNILKAVRGVEKVPPILVISARDRMDDMVTGLNLGADDYVAKPFDLRILVARMRAVLRRSRDRSRSLVISREITLDPATYVAVFRGIKSVLSAREFAVLYALMERPGSILSRSQMENRIYGWDEEIQSNAIDVVIHGLRKKYGKDIIRNIRGAGWMVANSEP